LSTSTAVTQILHDWSEGNPNAAARLMPLVYDELRRIGNRYFSQERSDHTLQATALVHEAYLKLTGEKPGDWRNRMHFSAVAARAMRQVLVEHARAHRADKRGGKLEKVYLDETRELGETRNPDLLELNEALKCFAALYPRESEVVELKFFGGLGRGEIAEVLNVSPKTISRDWSFAKAWLRRRLTEEHASG
jgi:RNA polymerase sigma factor (TIGR02999 family)